MAIQQVLTKQQKYFVHISYMQYFKRLVRVVFKNRINMHQRGSVGLASVGVLGKILLTVRVLGVKLAVLVSNVLVFRLVHSVN